MDKKSEQENKMSPKPEFIRSHYLGSKKLENKVAIITGGDSGIGRAVAIHFAREGAQVAIVYHENDKDANETIELIRSEGQTGLKIKGDLSKSSFCKSVSKKVLEKFSKIDVLINNAGIQFPNSNLTNIKDKQIRITFETNVFSIFYLTKAVLPSLKNGSSIINNASVTAYKGSPDLLDYSATKGAIIAFTRSLSLNLAKRKIRVNAVAPGPIWTPLIPSTFSGKRLKDFGKNVPFGRMGQPSEVAPSFVFLASDDSSYISGQVLHPNGGNIINS